MSSIAKTLSKATVFVAGIAAFASTALAQSYTYSSTAGDAAAGGIGLAMLGFWCCAGLFGLVLLGFNIWMAVDVLQRTEAEMPNRTMWLVLLIVGFFASFGWIAALVYFFTEKKKLDAAKKTAAK
jgi:hypothetical protein